MDAVVYDDWNGRSTDTINRNGADYIMAKLNGVKTVNMQDGKITKISYKGAEYARVVDDAQAGDLIYTTRAIDDTTANSFYAVVKNEYGDGRFYDEEGDSCASKLTPCEVFRKVGASTTPLEAKVDSLDKRVTALEAVKAEPKQAPKTFDDFPKGAKVCLLSGGGNTPLNGFINGETYEVVANDYDHRRGRRIQLSGGSNPNGKGYATPDQLELVAQYKTEKRHAKVGERILIVNAASITGGNYKNGDVLTVRRYYEKSKGRVNVVGFDSPYVGPREYEVIVEDAKPAQTLTHNGADYTLVSRKAQPGDVVVLTETGGDYFKTGKPYEVLDGVEIRDGAKFELYKDNMRRTVTTVLVYAPVKEALKVGVYAVITGKESTRRSRGAHNFKIGEVVKLNRKFNGGFKCERLDGGKPGGSNVNDEDLRLATDAEVEKAQAPKLKVGDTVEVIDGSASEYGDLKTGTVGKISDIELDWSEPYRVETDGDWDRFPASALRKSVVADKYPHKGDVVRVVSDRYGQGFTEGAIGVVTMADGTHSPVIKVGSNVSYAVVEVIARAKDRVDVA